MKTPIRDKLTAQSALHPLVKDGIQAVERAHRPLIDAALRSLFADSLDLDKALEQGNEQDHRWDYLLGHSPTHNVVGLEPHSASNGEISRVIKKRRAALDQLRTELKTGAAVAEWFWVASGTVDFTPIDKAHLRLSENGITFVGKALLKKHLDRLDGDKPGTKKRPRR